MKLIDKILQLREVLGNIGDLTEEAKQGFINICHSNTWKFLELDFFMEKDISNLYNYCLDFIRKMIDKLDIKLAQIRELEEIQGVKL